MKTYIVYVDGVEQTIIKAASHNAAEKRAFKIYPNVPQHLVSVEYTEI